jgi:hypothetical protein
MKHSSPLVVVLLVLLTGCSQATEQGASPVPSPSVTASQPASATPAAPDPVEEAPAAAASPTECLAEQLDIAIAAQPTASGAGQFYSEITFTNTSDVACFTDGPPSVFNMVDSASGAVLGLRGVDDGVAEVVQLAPLASAFSTVHFGSAGAYDCESAEADAAIISPPNGDQGRTIMLEQPITVCLTPSTYSVSWLSATSLFR